MKFVITVCTGRRCAWLLERRVGAAMPALRSAVQVSSQTVLVSIGCVDACAQAPVVALSHGTCQPGRLELHNTTWLGPVGRDQVNALCGWVVDDQPPPLPTALAGAVFVRTGR